METKDTKHKDDVLNKLNEVKEGAETKAKEIQKSVELIMGKLKPIRNEQMTINHRKAIITETEGGIVMIQFTDKEDCSNFYDSQVNFYK